jgi:hypothetical protein
LKNPKVNWLKKSQFIISLFYSRVVAFFFIGKKSQKAKLKIKNAKMWFILKVSITKNYPKKIFKSLDL